MVRHRVRTCPDMSGAGHHRVRTCPDTSGAGVGVSMTDPTEASSWSRSLVIRSREVQPQNFQSVQVVSSDLLRLTMLLANCLCPQWRPGNTKTYHKHVSVLKPSTACNVTCLCPVQQYQQQPEHIPQTNQKHDFRNNNSRLKTVSIFYGINSSLKHTD